jgi:hypothetical protein
VTDQKIILPTHTLIAHPLPFLRLEGKRREEPLVSGLAELLLIRLGQQPEGFDALVEPRGVDVPQRLGRGDGVCVQVLLAVGCGG